VFLLYTPALVSSAGRSRDLRLVIPEA